MDQDLVLDYQAQCSGGQTDCLPQGQPEITGVVTDQDTGQPLGGARVQMFLQADPSISIETATAADGGYSLEVTAMPAGFYIHQASKAGYQTATRGRWYGGVGTTMNFELRAEVTGMIVQPTLIDITTVPDRVREREVFLRNFTAEVVDWNIEESGGERVSAYFPDELPSYRVFLPALTGDGAAQGQARETTGELQVPADESWLQVSPVSGSLDPNSSQRLGIVVDTTGLESGIYEAALLIHTGSSETPELQVRVRLTVARPGVGS